MTNKKQLEVFSPSLEQGQEITTKGGSYTKFVFPFSYYPKQGYRLTEDELKKSHYNPVDMQTKDWTHRKRYLTEETASVLYERASWFELKCEAEIITCRLATGIYPIEIQRPKIVMFEWASKNEKSDLLRLGLLLVECRVLARQENGESIKPTLDDLLMFNELYRYWRIPFDDHKNRMRKLFSPGELDDNKSDKWFQLYLNKWLKYLKCPIQDKDSTVWNIASSTEFENSVSWWENEYTDVSINEDKSNVFGYNDDRCFVWTCALISGGEAGLGNIHKDDEYHPDWVKLLNVDLPDSYATRSSKFEQNWVSEKTYTRWRHHDCLYGFNHHSAAMLSDLVSDPPTWQHFSEQYFDMLLLMLYLKVTLFKFSRRLSKISAIALDYGDLGVLTKEDFGDLRKEFAIFTNLYQFPLISNHQQAIEMYSMMRKHLDVDEFFSEIQAEIKSTHEMIELQYTRKLTRKADDIASVGIPFAIGAFFVALFTIPEEFKMKIFDSENVITLPTFLIWMVCFAILAGAFCWFQFKKVKAR